MCDAKDTLLPDRFPLPDGEGQTLRCRSWDKLEKWALASERNACFLGGHYSTNEVVDKWGNCPDDSPYKAQAQAYYGQLHRERGY